MVLGPEPASATCEATTEDEDRTARDAIAAYERGEAIGAYELKQELGLD